MSKPGIIIKIGDNRELLAKVLLFLQKVGKGNSIEKQKRTLSILKNFDEAPKSLKRWACLKSLEKGLWSFSIAQNYGEQVGEQYISSDHWIFLEGKLIARLSELI